MIYTYDLTSIEEKEKLPGFHGKFIHSETMTLAFWNIEKGAELPEHHHINEQVINLEEGQFELTIDGDVKVMTAPSVLVIPPDLPHSGKALTDCKILDIFYPKREDLA